MGMMRRRARRRGMLVAGGLAYEAGKNRSREEEPQYAEEPQYEAPPPAPPPPAPTTEATDVDELQRLADLHSAGSLTDEEFQAAKAKILGT